MAINSDEFFNIVKDHMDDQPWKIVCEGCGADLDYDAEIDSDLDLKLTVYPCEHCKGK